MKSIFKNERLEKEYHQLYDRTLEMFGLPYTSKYIQTRYGETHTLNFGDPGKKPLLLLHGMTMSSTMWYPNIMHLLQERSVYAVDVIGDFGKSRTKSVIKDKKTAARWLLEVMDGLQLHHTDVAGHSMGGFLALNFTLVYPERVSKLLLYAPAGAFHKISPLFFVNIYPALLFHTEK
jgi:Predicted hydrolases or acyltransferases (alpha/beta hydrolase superfamily)